MLRETLSLSLYSMPSTTVDHRDRPRTINCNSELHRHEEIGQNLLHLPAVGPLSEAKDSATNRDRAELWFWWLATNALGRGHLAPMQIRLMLAHFVESDDLVVVQPFFRECRHVTVDHLLHHRGDDVYAGRCLPDAPKMPGLQVQRGGFRRAA